MLGRIISAAATVIADQARYIESFHLRQLRESETADAPQRTRARDGAKAWRLTLVKQGVGWRMHYWRISTPWGSLIEFANILKKQDPEEIFG